MLKFNYFDRDECKGCDVFTCAIDETHYDEMTELLKFLIDAFGEPDGERWEIIIENWFNAQGKMTPHTKLITISSEDPDISVYLRLFI